MTKPTRVDDILDVIDAGLQTPTAETIRDTSYNAPDRRDLCVRCQRNEPAEGDWCSGCRAFLLEDSDDDPMKGPYTGRRLVTEVHERPPESSAARLGALMQTFLATGDSDTPVHTFAPNPDGPPRRTITVMPPPGACTYHLTVDIGTGNSALVRRPDEEHWTSVPVRVERDDDGNVTYRVASCPIFDAFDHPRGDLEHECTTAVEPLGIGAAPSPDPEPGHRLRERALLAQRRREQRRTNRWGRP